ncbi:MAG: FecR domain-containing protein [Planctomycetes bacterium]|nr:FecR domain-containing protein [Planctomycetota bacterium]
MQHPEPHDLTALAYDLVEGAERETLLKHLAECDQCRATYDSFRHEQTLVRDAIVRDARSGPAEARALERTLLMLGAQGEESAPARGKLLSLPLWLWAAQAAAMLLVAVGLFFILRPEAEPDVIPVADTNRAAAVESGIALVSDNSGNWRQAEAVPFDAWTKAGEELTIQLLDGSSAVLQADAIFNITYEADMKTPILNVLDGRGFISAAGDAQLLVRTGDTRLHALPGAQVLVTSEGEADWSSNAQSLRSWTLPRNAQAEVKHGDVLVVPGSRKFSSVALRNGESMRWTPQGMDARDAAGQSLTLSLASLAMEVGTDAAHDPAELAKLEDSINALMLRLNDVQARHGELKTADWFLEDALRLRALGQNLQVRVVVRGTGHSSSIALSLNGVGVAAWTVGDVVSFEVSRDNGTTRHQYDSDSPEGLRGKVPADQHELLDLVKFEKQGQGWKVSENTDNLAAYRKKHKLPGND